MPYTTIPTKSDGDILSASYLNILSGNQEFLYSLSNGVNAPFNSWRSTQSTLDSTDMVWMGLHKLRYFHYKLTSQGGAWDYARVYFSGVKLAGNEAGATTLSGSYDLTSWAGLPNLVGAWVVTTAYEDDVNGNGTGGNGDDGSVVTNGGAYYRCILAHTSAAADEPGVGVNWATYWGLLTLPVVGDIVSVYADVNFASATEVTVEYFFETDASSL